MYMALIFILSHCIKFIKYDTQLNVNLFAVLVNVQTLNILTNSVGI